MSRTAFASRTNLPLRLDGNSIGAKAAAVFLGTLLLTASSWIEVPMVPVPVTMQTFAVTIVGALMGWRLGLATILAWYTEAAMGFPVLAGGAGGLAHFAGPTGGYLAGFLVAVVFVGFMAERGFTKRGILASFGVMLAGNALILALGAIWLTMLFGFETAITAGVTPFLVGAVLKSALAVAVAKGAFKLHDRAL